MTTPVTTHIPCPACAKPVRVIARPDQRHARLADHGKQLGVLCPGSGRPVQPATAAPAKLDPSRLFTRKP